MLEYNTNIFVAASDEPVVSTISLGSFLGNISITTSRIDKGDNSGAGLFYVDISISNSVPSFGSYNILKSSDSNDFISLTDSKGKAWSGNPIGVNTTSTGYEMILETVGKKGTTYSEISVSSDGVIAGR